jgi:hypothetical protein
MLRMKKSGIYNRGDDETRGEQVEEEKKMQGRRKEKEVSNRRNDAKEQKKLMLPSFPI